MRTAFWAAAFVGVMLVRLPVRAEVVDSSDTHFLVRNAVTVDAASGRVFRALTTEIGRWWDSAHTFFGSAANLSIDTRAGGCFCERLQDGRGVELMRVIYVEPGKRLRLSGTLGPLQESPLNGVATFTLTEAGGSTTVELTYDVAGYRSGPGGVGAVAGAVDRVLSEQLTRLKDYVNANR